MEEGSGGGGRGVEEVREGREIGHEVHKDGQLQNEC